MPKRETRENPRLFPKTRSIRPDSATNMPGIRRFHFVPVGGTAMVPLAALLLEEGHRVTGSDHTLYPPMSTTLERLGIPVATGFAADHVPPDTRRGRRRERRPARQRRGGRGGPPRPACPLAATGGARIPAAGEDLDRHHGDPRQDDDLGADVVAAPRFRTGSRASSSAARCRISAGVIAAAPAPTSCSKATSTTRRSSTGAPSFCTTSRSTSSSATSSSTMPISMPTSRPCSTRSARSWRSCPKTASSSSTPTILASWTSPARPARPS